MTKFASLALAGLIAALGVAPAYADGDPADLEKKQAEDAAAAAAQDAGVERKVWLDTRESTTDRVEPMDVLPLVKAGQPDAAAQADAKGKGKIVCSGRDGSGYVAVEGNTLKDVLESWAACEGWTVRWQTDRQYVLQASATFQGTFLSAGSELVGAFEQANPPVFGQFFAPNKVLVVTTPTELDGQ